MAIPVYIPDTPRNPIFVDFRTLPKCDVCGHSEEKHFNDGLYCVLCTADKKHTCRSTAD